MSCDLYRSLCAIVIPEKPNKLPQRRYTNPYEFFPLHALLIYDWLDLGCPEASCMCVRGLRCSSAVFRLEKALERIFSNPNSISMTFSIKSNGAKRGEKDWKIAVGAMRDANTDGLNLVEKAKVVFAKKGSD